MTVASTALGVPGYTFADLHEPERLASALRRVLSDPGLARRLGEAARARVEREFSADRMVEETLAVYRGLDNTGAKPML